METSDAAEIPSLPQEIIEEILSRLPVKSLLRFGHVAKSWCSLFRSKNFIKTHLENSSKNTDLIHHRIISNPVPSSSKSLKLCSLPTLLNEQGTNSFGFDNPRYICKKDPVHIVGCCNGLICIFLSKTKQFLLWNPSTKMSKELPDFDEKLADGGTCEYGFGYDESNDDYKVVGRLWYMHWPMFEYVKIRKVYSLKNNSWRKINCLSVPKFHGPGKFASGKLYFMSKSNSEIVSFDLTNEVYGTVEQPSCDLEPSSCPLLGMIGGCLSLTCNYQEPNRTHVWILKQYGVEQSWTTAVSLLRPCGADWKHCPPFLITLFIGPTGEILFMYGSILVVYNPKSDQFRRTGDSDSDGFIHGGIYVESLVPLVCDEDEQERLS